MNRSLKQDTMKTMSTKLSVRDVEQFQVICKENNWSQSEAIRYLIQSFLANSSRVDVFEKNDEPKETQQFYEGFKAINRVKGNLTLSNISSF
jgi:hypothetical protein